MRAPVLATGRAFRSQRARAVSEKRQAARARARIHQNRRAHSVRIQSPFYLYTQKEGQIASPFASPLLALFPARPKGPRPRQQA